MFVVSKIVGFLLKPVIWILLLAFLAIWIKSPKWQKRCQIALLALLLVFTNPVCIHFCAQAWEDAPGDVNAVHNTYDVGIVLGGYLNLDANATNNIAINRSGSRLTTALQLYQQGKIKRILLTGGSGRILAAQLPEAQVAYQWLRSVGVPDSALIVEDQARNTKENAQFSKNILSKMGLQQATTLLLTSTWHLPRAKRLFIQHGLPPTATFGMDPIAEQKPLAYSWQPGWEPLMKWELLMKEWVGYCFLT